LNELSVCHNHVLKGCDKSLYENAGVGERVTFVRTIKIKKEEYIYLFYIDLFTYALGDKCDIRTGYEIVLVLWDIFVSWIVTAVCDRRDSVREKEIEKKLVQEVKKRGGLCLKWVSPGFAGVPDRIVFLPKRRIGFVEVKALGERPRKIQLHRHAQLRGLGFRVYVLDDANEIGGMLDDIQTA